MSETRERDLGARRAWAVEEFGGGQLGNKSRTRRLVAMAERAAEAPAGQLTKVFTRPDELEAAYRWVENVNFNEKDVGSAAHTACAQRCAHEGFVFVPLDGCTLSVTDITALKGFGKVGTRETRGRGVEVMNAIAVSSDGTPLGLCGQAWWTRRNEAQQVPSRKRRLHEKETRHWLKALESVNGTFNAAGITTPRWFQLDAGGDFRELLAWAEQSDQLLTVRAAQNRRVADDDRYLWQTVAASPSLGQLELFIPRGRKRQSRMAELEVRSRKVTLQLSGGLGETSLWAVLVEEVAGTTPKSEAPISWLLLTNANVESFENASLVVYGYSQRWRVEEFHKAWKSVCKVEESQLEVMAFKLWATILASIAMRVERLKYLARNEPEQAATVELTATELAAIIALKGNRPPSDYVKSRTPTIGQAVLWIAELGGYVGRKRSGGPPGTIVIGRGLRDIETAVRVLVNTAGHV